MIVEGFLQRGLNIEVAGGAQDADDAFGVLQTAVPTHLHQLIQKHRDNLNQFIFVAGQGRGGEVLGQVKLH